MVVSATRSARPSMNSALARFLVENWCITWLIAPVRLNRPLHISTSRYTKVRSQGTSTSSNTTIPSISSRRWLRGWSMAEPAPWGTNEGRQMKRNPGVSTGSAKQNA